MIMTEMGESIKGGDQTPAALHLGPLRQFELLFVLRYLSTKEKLTCFAPLNRTWYAFTFQHYNWAQMPSLPDEKALLPFLSFLDRFHSLSGIALPFFPGDFINSGRFPLLH